MSGKQRKSYRRSVAFLRSNFDKRSRAPDLSSKAFQASSSLSLHKFV